MSLNWDLAKIQNYEAVCFYEAPRDDPNYFITKGDRVMNPVTNSLIWASIGVGLPGITRENAPEFFARLRLLEKLDGALMIRAVGPDGKRPEGETAFLTEHEVFAHIGLHCNVSTESRSAWLRRFGNDLDRLADRFKRSAEEVAA